MQLFLIFTCMFILNVINTTVFESKHNYVEKYFSTYVDHFSYTNETAKFPLRYLISVKNWKPDNAILFYTGNEGDITLFAENTGFIWELAEELSAMVVFAEHRYYGKSLPFGNQSYLNPSKFGYLSAEQALADYADLIVYLQKYIPGASKSAVVAFGGSYGGMLAAYFRQKYPNIVAGAVAASAPVLMVGNTSDCNAAFRILTNAYRVKGSLTCTKNVHQFWSVLKQFNNPEGLKKLSSIFRTCQPLPSTSIITESLPDILFTMGMANYPYPASFLADMPAWPVTHFCKPLNSPLTNPINLVSGIAKGLQVYFNYTGKLKCIDLNGGGTPGLDAYGWDLQTCTELPMPMCMDGKTDMFYPSPFDPASFNKNCQYQFSVQPRWGWGQTLFWFNKLSAASNIVYSNGELDPWFAGGVRRAQSSTVHVITIRNGAHHVDLRASNALDTPDITAARRYEKKMVRLWINQHKSMNL